MDRLNSEDKQGPADHQWTALHPVYEFAEAALPRITFLPLPDVAVDLMVWIAGQWQTRCRVTYVLLESRDTAFDAARYDYHGTLDLGAVKDFFSRHGRFIVADGRHALWLASADGRSMLIYDRHGFLTVFGDVTALRDRLVGEGCRPGFLDASLSHRPANDQMNGEFASLMQGWKWLKRPLNAHDLG